MLSHLSKFLKNRALSGVFIGALITLLLSIGILTNTFRSLHEHFSDYLYTHNEPSSEIVIIALDDKSTQPAPEGFGRFSQWTRERFTELLTVLEKENPKTISIDFIFHTPTETLPKTTLKTIINDTSELSNKEKIAKYEEFFEKYKSSLDDPIDEAFGQKLRSFDNLILDTIIHPDGQSLIKPLLKFSLNARLGVVNTYLDSRGVLRQSTPIHFISSENKYYDDLAVSTLREYLGAEEFQPTDLTETSLKLKYPGKETLIPLENGQMNVNFFGDPYSFKMISFIDVVHGDFEKDLFKDKIVLIGGTSSKEFHDEYFTPKSNKTPMPGIEFIANQIQTILEEKFLTNQSDFSQIMTSGAIAIGLTIGLNFLSILFSIIISIIAIIIYILAAHFFFGQGIILNLIYPFVAIVLAYLSSWIYKYFIADKNKREITSAFGHYVSPDLVKQISKNPDLVKLGGEKKTVTVFFSDIKDSTTHAEKGAPEVWVSQVNEYFTEMEKILKSYGGTLDKYEGDAIMGFWNAPITQNNHIERAYLTALNMQSTLQKLNQKWATENRTAIEIRIGINTGEALVGNFGSSDRFDYTVMGDTVNTASRLESSANKTYGTKIIVSGFESARAEQHTENLSPGIAKHPLGVPSSNSAHPELSQKFILRELDTVILPGKKESVKLFELMGTASQANAEDLKKTAETYAAGLTAYRQKDFKTALEKFSSQPNDKPSQIMAERSKRLQNGEKLPELDGNIIYHIVNK